MVVNEVGNFEFSVFCKLIIVKFIKGNIDLFVIRKFLNYICIFVKNKNLKWRMSDIKEYFKYFLINILFFNYRVI